MSKISIQYEDTTGKSREWIASISVKKLDMRSKNIASVNLTALEQCVDLEEVNLSWNEIKKVDLTPLSSCSKLQILNLKQNDLRQIELTPLRDCSDLRILDISENCLSSIDLRPLSGCKNLQKLILEENEFGRINLQPIRQCTELEVLDLEHTGLCNIDLNVLKNFPNLRRVTLHGNNLKKVDLSSLTTCNNLQVVDLLNNNLRDVDLTPLLACDNLNVLFISRGVGKVLLKEDTLSSMCTEIRPGLFGIGRYDVPVPIHSLDVIRKLAAIVQAEEPDSWKHIHLMRNLSKILNLQDLGFLDVTPEQLLSIVKESDIDTMRDRVIDKCCRQIENGGTTIGLKVDGIVQLALPEVVVKLPRIFDLRRDEMRRVTVKIDTGIDSVDLKGLHLTAYGHELLSALRLGLKCSTQEFKQVLDSFEYAGFTINTSERRSIQTVNNPLHKTMNISRSMRDYFWVLVQPARQGSQIAKAFPLDE